MAKHYTDTHRRIDQRTPRIVFRMPSPADLEELRAVALESSTSVSEFIRTAIDEKIQKERSQAAS